MVTFPAKKNHTLKNGILVVRITQSLTQISLLILHVTPLWSSHPPKKRIKDVSLVIRSRPCDKQKTNSSVLVCNRFLRSDSEKLKVVPCSSDIRNISHVRTLFSLVYIVSHTVTLGVASCGWCSVSLCRRLNFHGPINKKLCISLNIDRDCVWGKKQTDATENVHTKLKENATMSLVNIPIRDFQWTQPGLSKKSDELWEPGQMKAICLVCSAGEHPRKQEVRHK